MSEFNITKLSRTAYDHKDVGVYVRAEHERFKTARQEIEETWLEAWALYLNTSQSIDYMRAKVLETVGNVNDDWRHKINTGKAFEAVETIHSYLMAAFFPNNDWFDAVPMLPGDDNHTLSRVVKKYVQNKLEYANFQSEFSNFLRQLIVTGNSVMALPWRYDLVTSRKVVKSEQPLFEELGDDPEWETVEKEVETNRPEFETLDIFDVYLDPTAINPNDSTIIRVLRKTKAEIISLFDEGVYEGLDKNQIAQLEPTRTTTESYNSEQYRNLNGYVTSELNEHEIEIIEYWGDLHLPDVTYHDVVVTMINDTVVRFETNPYWRKPFVVGTYIRIPRQPYAMGALQPNLGMLHQLNIITNQRLDNIELHVNKMWALVDDGVLDPDDVETVPGKVFKMGNPSSLMPVDMGRADFTVTYQEAAVLESTIDKNMGTGNYVGANSQREGERVTAAEIAAVRDAGGNRLSGIHKHIEETALKEILERVFELMRQFVRENEIVRIAGDKAGEYKYFQVGVEELNQPLSIRPMGAGHVIERKKYIQDRLDFIAAVSQIQQMADKIDYEAILHDLLINWGFDEPEKYLKKEEQAPEANPLDRGLNVQQDALDAGGAPMLNNIQAQLQADGGASMLGEMLPTQNPDIMPEDMPVPLPQPTGAM